MTKKEIAALSIPTGIGADIGGYAGDFGCIARKFSDLFYCIVNPNAVNGGILSAINYNMAYMEGYLFDEFLEGNIAFSPLKPYKTNKIGVIFDCAVKKNVLNIHLNTLSALKTVQGADILEIEYTKKPVGVEIILENGISTGNLKNPKSLIEAAGNLIKKGADAIAVVSWFENDIENIDYSNGNGIDPVGGVEAIISHLITKEFNIPCANCPAFLNYDISEKLENPKVSSEMISSTYLPCVIQGLMIAPKISKKGLIKNNDVKYLIVPYNAAGSKAVLSAYKNNIKIITVENKTKLNVTLDKLKIKPYGHFKTYEECLENII